MSISNYVIEFELLYHKIKSYKFCKFLNNANISVQHKQLLRTTLTELKDDNMKDQMKAFSVPINFSSIVQHEQNIKV